MATQVRRLITRAVVIPIAAMAVFTLLLAWEVHLLVRDAALVDQTDRVIGKANQVQRLLIESESDARAFLLTRDARFVEPLDAARARIGAAEDELASLVAGDDAQSARVRALRAESASMLERAKRSVDRAAAAPESEIDRADVGQEILARREAMDAIGATLSALVDAEEKLRGSRETAARGATMLTGATAFAVVSLVAALLFIVTRRDLMAVTDRFETALDAERAARAVAEEALRVREAFLQMASHELKTPVTSLQLQLESILRHVTMATSQAPEEAAGTVEKIERTARAALRQLARLQELVTTLLDVQRLSATGSTLNVSDADARVLFRDAVEQIVHELRDAGCTLTLDAPATFLVRADPMRLGQVLVNLLSNAIKFGRGRPVHVTMARSGARSVIRVRDEGLGISQADQARIFDRFERAVSNEHFHGFGLGLWIVKSLVEKMGGTVRVESEQGRGATFIVDLATGEEEGPDITSEHVREAIPGLVVQHDTSKHEGRR
jgi:signal transduction histidine kinase